MWVIIFPSSSISFSISVRSSSSVKERKFADCVLLTGIFEGCIVLPSKLLSLALWSITQQKQIIVGQRISYVMMAMAIIFLFSCGGGGDNDDDIIVPLPPVVSLGEITELSHLPIDGLVVTDVWGFLNDGHEYAVIGDFARLVDSLASPMGNVTIIDVTNPTDPQIVSVIKDVPASDVKVWKNYLYISDGGGGFIGVFPDITGSLIYDISDPANPVKAGVYPHAHNVFIDERGYMYHQDRDPSIGTSIYDLNDSPTDPVFIWVDKRIQRWGHDVTVVGDRLYDFHWEFGTQIYDVSNPFQPAFLGRIEPHRLPDTHHSGWATEDNSTLVIADELGFGGSDLTIWDVSDPTQPKFLTILFDNNSSVHNVWIKDGLLFVAYYDSGLKIFDIEDPTKTPIFLAAFDTNFPGDLGINEFFLGAWGIYVNDRTGNIYISDIDNGLYIFSFERGG